MFATTSSVNSRSHEAKILALIAKNPHHASRIAVANQLSPKVQKLLAKALAN